MEGLIFGILRQLKIETVQCSFLWFRPSGDRVLPLSLKYVFLALRRGMLRVGCNSSRISSMSAIDWRGKRLLPAPTPLPTGDCCCGVCLEWIVCCLRLVSPIYIFLHLLLWIIYVRFVEYGCFHNCRQLLSQLRTAHVRYTLQLPESSDLLNQRPSESSDGKRLLNPQVTRFVTLGTLHCLSYRSTHRKLRKKMLLKLFQDFKTLL